MECGSVWLDAKRTDIDLNRFILNNSFSFSFKTNVEDVIVDSSLNKSINSKINIIFLQEEKMAFSQFSYGVANKKIHITDKHQDIFYIFARECLSLPNRTHILQNLFLNELNQIYHRIYYTQKSSYDPLVLTYVTALPMTVGPLDFRDVIKFLPSYH